MAAAATITTTSMPEANIIAFIRALVDNFGSFLSFCWFLSCLGVLSICAVAFLFLLCYPLVIFVVCYGLYQPDPDVLGGLHLLVASFS